MTRFLIPGLCLCILSAPAIAQEDCPRGPGALDAGVTVDFDGFRIDYQRQSDGRILERERYSDDPQVWFYRSDPTGLVHEAWTEAPDGTIDPDTHEFYRYDFAGGLPVARPESNWTGRETSVIGGVEETALVSWSFSKPQDYAIGPCVYEVLWIYETRNNDPTGDQTGTEPLWINQYVHLVDLGVSIFLGGEDLGTDPILETPVAIFPSAKDP